jgi:hypothetical protein
MATPALTSTSQSPPAAAPAPPSTSPPPAGGLLGLAVHGAWLPVAEVRHLQAQPQCPTLLAFLSSDSRGGRLCFSDFEGSSDGSLVQSPPLRSMGMFWKSLNVASRVIAAPAAGPRMGPSSPRNVAYVPPSHLSHTLHASRRSLTHKASVRSTVAAGHLRVLARRIRCRTTSLASASTALVGDTSRRIVDFRPAAGPARRRDTWPDIALFCPLR